MDCSHTPATIQAKFFFFVVYKEHGPDEWSTHRSIGWPNVGQPMLIFRIGASLCHYPKSRMPRIIRPSTSPPMGTFDPYRSPSSLTQFFNSKAPSTLKSVPEMLFSLNGLFQRTKPNKNGFHPSLMPCIFHPCVHSYFKKPIFHCAVEKTSDHTQCNCPHEPLTQSVSKK